jgi:hypothetical protein
MEVTLCCQPAHCLLEGMHGLQKRVNHQHYVKGRHSDKVSQSICVNCVNYFLHSAKVPQAWHGILANCR